LSNASRSILAWMRNRACRSRNETNQSSNIRVFLIAIAQLSSLTCGLQIVNYDSHFINPETGQEGAKAVRSARVRARADYVDPFVLADGLDLVAVNGVPAFGHDEGTGNAGQLPRHRANQPGE